VRVCGCNVVVVLGAVGCTWRADCCVVVLGRTPRVVEGTVRDAGVATGAAASAALFESNASRSRANRAPNIVTKAPRADAATHQRDLT